MDVNCPHCRTEFEADEREYGRFIKCQICGKGFIVGVVSRYHKADVGTLKDSVSSELYKQPHRRSMQIRSRQKRIVAQAVSSSVSREMRECATEGEKSGTIAIVFVSLFLIAGSAFVFLPKLNSVARDSVWSSGRQKPIQLEEYYDPTQTDVKRAKEAMPKRCQSAYELSTIGRGMAPLLLKGIGRAFDCPLCGKPCKIPSSLNYKVGEVRDCLCPHCRKCFRHVLR